MRSRRFREPFHAQVSKPPARRRICQVDRTNYPFKLQVTRRGRLVLHAGGWARGGQGNPSDSDRPPLCGPDMVPLPEMKSLLRTLMAFGKLAKA